MKNCENYDFKNYNNLPKKRNAEPQKLAGHTTSIMYPITFVPATAPKRPNIRVKDTAIALKSKVQMMRFLFPAVWTIRFIIVCRV